MSALWDDTQDFEDVERGSSPAATSGRSPRRTGGWVWTSTPTPSSTAAPETVNPSLWRQGQLLTRDGLFEVVPGIYQLRGSTWLVMSVIEGDEGVVVIDPLISKETAAAASRLPPGAGRPGHQGGDLHALAHRPLRRREGHRQPGRRGGRKVSIIAPDGFMEHAVSENVFAGTAMARRAGYMYGAALDKGLPGRWGPVWGRPPPPGSRPDPPDRRHHHDRAGADGRRCPDRVPGHAGH